MKTLFIIITLITSSVLQQKHVQLVSPQVFAEALKKEKGVLLDIRTPGEYKKGHLKGSILMDFFRDDFEKSLDKLDKNKTYFIYCGIGGRSEECGGMMESKGFKKVYDLDGGISRWKAAGLPVEN